MGRARKIGKEDRNSIDRINHELKNTTYRKMRYSIKISGTGNFRKILVEGNLKIEEYPDRRI